MVLALLVDSKLLVRRLVVLPFMGLVHGLAQEAVVGVWTSNNILFSGVALEMGIMPVCLHRRMEGLVQHKSRLLHLNLSIILGLGDSDPRRCCVEGNSLVDQLEMFF